ncbi:MAG TPA: hypothetical protein VFU21_31695 [Kofleriaceae bacterium]|nr:hypothetical protein [Kofleriaceae bacterium]
MRVLAAALALLAAAPAARAGDNDLVLARLAEVVVDEDGDPIDAVGDDGDFRSLASELGVVFAPRLSQPADTLGFGGFQFTADVALTRVHTDRPYWRALASSPDPSDPSAKHGGDLMTTVGLFARKGIWLPAPSFEVGLGAVHLAGSEMWAGQLYAKLALVEGYHRLLIPSVALRGGASRMMGSDQLGLTVVSLDLSVSKEVGIAGTFNASPYLGVDWLLVIPRSEVIDKTPHIDSIAEPTDAAMDFTFVDQEDISRYRLFGGVLLRYYVFTLGLEAAYAVAGRSADEATGAEDQSGSQASFTLTGGLDF